MTFSIYQLSHTNKSILFIHMRLRLQVLISCRHKLGFGWTVLGIVFVLTEPVSIYVEVSIVKHKSKYEFNWWNLFSHIEESICREHALISSLAVDGNVLSLCSHPTYTWVGEYEIRLWTATNGNFPEYQRRLLPATSILRTIKVIF